MFIDHPTHSPAGSKHALTPRALYSPTFTEVKFCDLLRLDSVFRKFASPWPYTFYPSFTEGLRLINTEERGRVYSVGGPGSIAVFLSTASGVRSLAAGRSPSTVCC
jgi:hypothetical protein